jgi:hypothetical protein
LVAFEGIMVLSCIPALSPFLACCAIITNPAELNAFFLYCTGNEGTMHSHITLAPTAPALTLCEV